MRAGGRVIVAVIVLAGGRAAAQQDLGHKILGSAGLDAGAQAPAGVYAQERFVFYAANELVDRNGNSVPVGLRLTVAANAVGAGVSYELPRIATYVNASIGIPIARVSASLDRPDVSIDRFGLSDIYLQPMRLGWRVPHVDVVTGYALYIPTGRYEPGGRGTVSRAHFTNEFSLGSTLYFDANRKWQLSLLASYELNGRKLGIDVTRGDTVQIQGGIGGRVGLFELGLIGYALWQVRDDRGADLPPVLTGARDRASGLGVESGVILKQVRGRLTLRYAHDFAVTSRPLGQTVLVALTFAAWMPKH